MICSAARRYTLRALSRGGAPRTRTSSVVPSTSSAAVWYRTHMNHGGDPNLKDVSATAPGPRSAGIGLGLEGATGLHNILRLLESSHGPHAVALPSSQGFAWHPEAKIWTHNDTEGWILTSIDSSSTEQQSSRTATMTTPSVQWLIFSDARTALAKVMGMDGLPRYLSILQLDEHKPHNDGWRIVREVISAGGRNYPSKSFTSVKSSVLSYLDVEHGGGLDDKEHAETIFADQASLLTVGSSDHETPQDWQAPAGHFLEIPMTTYLDGVLTQTMHGFEASQHDDIVSIDVLPCGNAAAAVVRVGNGNQSQVFEDHLLLGRSKGVEDWNYWRILSKTFSPHPWPQDDDDLNSTTSKTTTI
ncbi:expressed unknown protein [Seminavis robusta]|uniref:Uncharacterized protein n=1 Tax=Seminavis robusta TaxID=568900 RepID=A0A9N8HX92_9STRA|nr:expressed unknown protein [Seminavis robusta]|eukprot:Sro1769_g296420.1 n/a (359) ;mRNA; r:4426-5502